MKTIQPVIPGRFYHIYNHAVGNDLLFREERNYSFFLNKYLKYIQPFTNTYAFALMPNHFHFLIRFHDEDLLLQAMQERTKVDVNADISKLIMRQFGNFFNSYAKSVNKVYNRMGSLFCDDLRRIEVTDRKYLLQLIHYIHHNPVRHGFTESPGDWPFTSFHPLCANEETWLRRDAVLSWFGGLDKFKEFHRQPIRRGFAGDEFETPSDYETPSDLTT